MTFLEIYNRILFDFYGAYVTNIAANVTSNLQGANGLIAQYHRKLQRDFNYWFMRSKATTVCGVATVSRERASNVATIITESAHSLAVGDEAMVTGLGDDGYNNVNTPITIVSVPTTTSFTYSNTGDDETTEADTDGVITRQKIAVPSYFKEEIGSVIDSAPVRFVRASDGTQVNLEKFALGNENVYYPDTIYRAQEYPDAYTIRGGYFYLYPFPVAIGSLYLDYWNYLARPISSAWSSPSYSDDMTEHGAECIINLCLMHMCRVAKDFDKYAIAVEAYNEGLRELRIVHESWSAALDTNEYADYW